MDNTLDASGNIVEIALKCEVVSLTKVLLFEFLRCDSALQERIVLNCKMVLFVKSDFRIKTCTVS